MKHPGQAEVGFHVELIDPVKDVLANLLLSAYVVGGHILADLHLDVFVVPLAKKQEIDSFVLLQGKPGAVNHFIIS